MKNGYYVIVEANIPYPRYYSEKKYVASVHYATHFETKEDALKHIPDDGVKWKVMYVNWFS